MHMENASFFPKFSFTFTAYDYASRTQSPIHTSPSTAHLLSTTFLRLPSEAPYLIHLVIHLGA
jgi:hypothetical protein